MKLSHLKTSNCDISRYTLKPMPSLKVTQSFCFYLSWAILEETTNLILKLNSWAIKEQHVSNNMMFVTCLLQQIAIPLAVPKWHTSASNEQFLNRSFCVCADWKHFSHIDCLLRLSLSVFPSHCRIVTFDRLKESLVVLMSSHCFVLAGFEL